MSIITHVVLINFICFLSIILFCLLQHKTIPLWVRRWDKLTALSVLAWVSYLIAAYNVVN